MTRSSASAEAVLDAVAERREQVNEAIEEELPIHRPEQLYEASRHLLDAGGKRLRPAVLLLVGEALIDAEPTKTEYRQFPTLDGEEIDLMAAAVSIEIIQSFTLIHDDIMDDDDLRRGVPAVHREYDLEMAILAGDTLYSTAFEVMLRTGAKPERSLKALQRLANTCTKICEGQAFDVGFERRTDVTVEEYLEMIELKTAVLYGAAASVPAMLLGADEETVASLYGYGIDVGRGFQIQDDVLDLTTPSERLGKQRGSDLIEGKRTLITLHAREQGVDVDELIDSDDRESVSEVEIEAAVERLQEVGSIGFARDRATGLIDRGKERLSVLPDNESRQLLSGLADYLIERRY